MNIPIFEWLTNSNLFIVLVKTPDHIPNSQHLVTKAWYNSYGLHLYPACIYAYEGLTSVCLLRLVDSLFLVLNRCYFAQVDWLPVKETKIRRGVVSGCHSEIPCHFVLSGKKKQERSSKFLLEFILGTCSYTLSSKMFC